MDEYKTYLHLDEDKNHTEILEKVRDIEGIEEAELAI